MDYVGRRILIKKKDQSEAEIHTYRYNVFKRAISPITIINENKEK